MPVKTLANSKDGMYFITFTCCDWVPLFQMTDGYDAVYKWFDYLKDKGHYINGYVLAQVCSMVFVWLRTCVAIIVLLILMAQVRYF